MPRTLDDLTKPAYKGKLVVENPATSSPGLAFLLASVAKFGDRRLARLLEAAAEQRREGRRRLGAGVRQRLLRRRRPRRLPARGLLRVEPAGRGGLREAAAEGRADRARCRHVLPPGRVRRACSRARRTRRRRRSSSTSCSASSSRPTSRCRCSCSRCVTGTPLPRCSRSTPTVPTKPLTLPPAEIGANRDEWIEQWTNTVLR